MYCFQVLFSVVATALVTFFGRNASRYAADRYHGWTSISYKTPPSPPPPRYIPNANDWADTYQRLRLFNGSIVPPPPSPLYLTILQKKNPSPVAIPAEDIPKATPPPQWQKIILTVIYDALVITLHQYLSIARIFWERHTIRDEAAKVVLEFKWQLTGMALKLKAAYVEISRLREVGISSRKSQAQDYDRMLESQRIEFRNEYADKVDAFRREERTKCKAEVAAITTALSKKHDDEVKRFRTQQEETEAKVYNIQAVEFELFKAEEKCRALEAESREKSFAIGEKDASLKRKTDRRADAENLCNQRIAEMRNKLEKQKISSEESDKLRSKVHDLKLKIDALKKEKDQMEADHKLETFKAAEKARKAQENELKRVDAQVSKFNKEISSLKASESDLKASKSKLEKELGDGKHLYDELNKKLKAAEIAREADLKEYKALKNAQEAEIKKHQEDSKKQAAKIQFSEEYVDNMVGLIGTHGAFAGDVRSKVSSCQPGVLPAAVVQKVEPKHLTSPAVKPPAAAVRKFEAPSSSTSQPVRSRVTKTTKFKPNPNHSRAKRPSAHFALHAIENAVKKDTFDVKTQAHEDVQDQEAEDAHASASKAVFPAEAQQVHDQEHLVKESAQVNFGPDESDQRQHNEADDMQEVQEAPVAQKMPEVTEMQKAPEMVTASVQPNLADVLEQLKLSTPVPPSAPSLGPGLQQEGFDFEYDLNHASYFTLHPEMFPDFPEASESHGEAMDGLENDAEASVERSFGIDEDFAHYDPMEYLQEMENMGELLPSPTMPEMDHEMTQSPGAAEQEEDQEMAQSPGNAEHEEDQEMTQSPADAEHEEDHTMAQSPGDAKSEKDSGIISGAAAARSETSSSVEWEDVLPRKPSPFSPFSSGTPHMPSPPVVSSSVINASYLASCPPSHTLATGSDPPLIPGLRIQNAPYNPANSLGPSPIAPPHIPAFTSGPSSPAPPYIPKYRRGPSATPSYNPNLLPPTGIPYGPSTHSAPLYNPALLQPTLPTPWSSFTNPSSQIHGSAHTPFTFSSPAFPRRIPPARETTTPSIDRAWVGIPRMSPAQPQPPQEPVETPTRFGPPGNRPTLTPHVPKTTSGTPQAVVQQPTGPTPSSEDSSPLSSAPASPQPPSPPPPPPLPPPSPPALEIEIEPVLPREILSVRSPRKGKPASGLFANLKKPTDGST